MREYLDQKFSVWLLALYTVKYPSLRNNNHRGVVSSRQMRNAANGIPARLPRKHPPNVDPQLPQHKCSVQDLSCSPISMPKYASHEMKDLLSGLIFALFVIN